MRIHRAAVSACTFKNLSRHSFLENPNSARIISSQEAIELFTMVRFGIDMEILKHVDHKALNELFIIIQPAHLQKIEGKKLNAFERDTKRAEVIRQKLGGRDV